ncbi:LAMI_0C01354g1_1 [Lachancea mirantina]|uniref:LAMI_0C01354g1_1 n=1 Tax=Lachancea mirantina TaxID=1230905 RepID=A0A1G4J037_9SACH|nr:LAMI_0C01354g1_1 [Lachancea mirantina]
MDEGSPLLPSRGTKTLARSFPSHKRKSRSSPLGEGSPVPDDVQSTNLKSLIGIPSRSAESQVRPSLWDRSKYYFPCLGWIPHYTMSKLMGDLVAGMTLASFQIPLAMSFSTSIAHTPPTTGLNSLVVAPIVYALFGTVPQMVVGPESAISLVVGQAIERARKHHENYNATDACVVLSFIGGVCLFLSGALRFGFLDNVLSRALLRGFISAVSLVMILNSLVSELKLEKVLADTPEHYHSPFQKILFLIEYAPKNYHVPTAVLSFACIGALFFLKYTKRAMMRKFRWAVFFPDILLVVIVTIFVSSTMDLKRKFGIDVVGDFDADGISELKNPLSKARRSMYSDLVYPAFMAAILGFFESTIASKSLASAFDFDVSSNRELIALGSTNMVCSLVAGLPSFGGYGRSKVNAYSGGKTVVSGVAMGFFTLLTMRFLLEYIKNIPMGCLSAITTVIGFSLIEESPADIVFYWKCKGYQELGIFAVTLLTTFAFSVEVGITVGCLFSLIRVIKLSGRSGIQILGRVAGTDQFVNADDYFREMFRNRPDLPPLEQTEGCLIVKIPEPLFFTNAEDLKSKLNRLELHGSLRTHPASPQFLGKSMTRRVVLDMNGMTSIDASAAQVLHEIVTSFQKRYVRVFLARVPITQGVREMLISAGIAEIAQRNHDANTGVAENSWSFENIQDALRAGDSYENVDLYSTCGSLTSSLVNTGFT